MIIKNEKIKSIVYTIVALGLSMFVGRVFYWLVDLSVYNHIMATVTTGRPDQIEAYMAWYSNYDWLLLILEFLINILVTVVCLKYLLKLSSRDIKGWLPLENIRELAVGLLLGAVSISIVFFTLVLTGNAHVVSWQPQFTTNALTYLLIFILVGISEELFYRGFVIATLRTYQNKWFSILLSSIIFSFIHFFNNEFHFLSFLNIVLIGIVFAYAFIETNSLWLPIGYHILWNYFQGNVYGFNVSGITVPGIFITEYQENTIMNGGGFGPEGGLVTTVVTLLAMLFIKWYVSNRQAPSKLKFNHSSLR